MSSETTSASNSMMKASDNVGPPIPSSVVKTEAIPTWNMTPTRRKLGLMYFMSLQAYIRMSEGAAMNVDNQEKAMVKFVDGLITDWVEAEGMITVKNVLIPTLKPELPHVMKSTPAGTVCTLAYSRYTLEKQVSRYTSFASSFSHLQAGAFVLG